MRGPRATHTLKPEPPADLTSSSCGPYLQGTHRGLCQPACPAGPITSLPTSTTQSRNSSPRGSGRARPPCRSAKTTPASQGPQRFASATVPRALAGTQGPDGPLGGALAESPRGATVQHAPPPQRVSVASPLPTLSQGRWSPRCPQGTPHAEQPGGGQTQSLRPTCPQGAPGGVVEKVQFKSPGGTFVRGGRLEPE